MRVDPNQFLELSKAGVTPAERGAVAVSLEHAAVKRPDIVTGHSFDFRDNVYEKPKGEAKEEVQEAAGAVLGSAEARKDQMAVLSNTMSEEDFRELREQGGDAMSMDSAEIVTVVDKIKIRMAEAGAEVGTITASSEAISAISGGRITGDQAAAVLTEADLPPTTENVSDTRKAYELASSLTSFSDGAVKYMVERDLSGSIENLYYASSGAGAGFGTETLPEETVLQMKPRMEQVIEEAGLSVNEETLEESTWMVANEILLNEDNLLRVDELRKMELPFEKEEILGAITDALRDGKRPQQGLLLESDKALTRLSARRMLSETQLQMTEQANRSLSVKGMEIDTGKLRETVEQLRKEERQYYERLLTDAGAEATEVQIDELKGFQEAIDEIKELPAAVLGLRKSVGIQNLGAVRRGEEVSLNSTEAEPFTGVRSDLNTLSGIREAGLELKVQMDRAGEAYDKMGTEIRRDLGDSIQKAFRNLDSVLRNLELPDTEANRRAVRILAYNRTEVTAEAVTEIKAADEEVQRALKSLTPPVVARMVKENINPLDLNLKDLQRTAAVLSEGTGIREEDRFSEYLYKLERNNRISEAERESYIGIYRLLHQVEKTDGAVVGALHSAGAEITMRSLLSAVRTGKKGSMDYRVDDEFGGVAGKERSKDILTQVDTAFDVSYETNVMKDIAEEISPEAFRTLMKKDPEWESRRPEEFLDALRKEDTSAEDSVFLRQQMEEFADAAKAEEAVYRMLERYDLPNSAANILALQQMAQYPNTAVRRLFGRPVEDYRDENGEVDFEEVKDSLFEEFGEAVSEPKELAEAQKKLADVAENVMRTMLNGENNAVTELDIRSLRLAANRFRVAGGLSEQENYHIPVMVMGETGEMNLKIVSGSEKKGLIDIMFSLSSLGSVAAKLEVSEGRLTGFVASDRRETVDLFSERGEELIRGFTGIEGIRSVTVNPIFQEELDLTHFNASTEEENAALRKEIPSEDRPRTKTLYQVAKSFLSVLKSF